MHEQAMLPHRLKTYLTSSHAILGAVVIVALLMVAICAYVLFQSREDALSRAHETSRNLGVMAQHDIERNFELYDLSLQAVVKWANDPDVMDLPWRLRNGLLFDQAASASYLGPILVLDSQGDVVIDSKTESPPKLNLSNRKFFEQLRDHPDLGLYISDPQPSELRPAMTSIVLSRRLSGSDGSFKGVVLMEIDTDYFRALFTTITLGSHSLVALLDRDGAMLTRYPYLKGAVGHNVGNLNIFENFKVGKEGFFSAVSPFDSEERFYYFRNFPTLPFIIVIAEAGRDIYAKWERRAVAISAMMAVLLAGLAALAFALIVQLQRRTRAEAKVALLARTDGITGLNNRRAFDEILNQEWRRAKRTQNVLSLLFMDIDWFKSYNDTYGHQAGDKALMAVAGAIADIVHRPTDYSARYGGEEFVAVLPDTEPDEAQRIAEKIRMAVGDLGIEHAGSRHGCITVSIGVSAWVPGDDGDANSLVRNADQALYSAKMAGRDRVMRFDALVV
jgi:diguanylate cyclase (GGDEF)-like protein